MKTRFCRLMPCASILAFSVSAPAASIVWDGTTDTNWTNGPQDNSGGGFPFNGSAGANWTIDGGSAGQVAPADAGAPTSLLINYLYTGHDWTINSATISEDAQVRLSGGSLNISDSTVSLMPSSANTTGILSGLNIGQNGVPTTGVVTNSTLNLQRANGGGSALLVLGGSDLTLVNSNVNLSSETALGGLGISNANSSLVMDANSNITMDGDLVINGNGATLTNNGGTINARSMTATTQDNQITMNGGVFNLTVDTAGVSLKLTNANTAIDFLGADVDMLGNLELTSPLARVNMDGGTLDAPSIRLNAGGGGTAQDLMFDFKGGDITVTDVNPLRGNSFEGNFNWTGAAGSGTIVHTDLSNPNSTLARKTFQGFFAIDGTRINPLTDPALDGLAALNAELAALVVNDKYFEITEDAGMQTLNLLSVGGLVGDLDGDGFVGINDLNIVLGAWNQNVPPADPAADPSGDGFVGIDDLNEVLGNWNAGTPPAGSAAVPEPATLAILGMGCVAMLRRR